MALWCRRAAEPGDVDGQLDLGLMPAWGLGVKPSFYETFKWFERAARTSPNSEFHDKALFKRENAASMLGRKQFEKAARRGSSWKPKSR